MFDWIVSTPEFRGYNPFNVYNYLMRHSDNPVVNEECVNDGATDAYMACLSSGNFDNLEEMSIKNALKYYQREYRHLGSAYSILSKGELAEGRLGVDPDSIHTDALEMTKVSADLSITTTVKALCNENGAEMLEKLKLYIRRAVSALKLKHSSHPDYDVANVLVAYYCEGKLLKEIHKELPSFRSYQTLSHVLSRDLQRVQGWWKLDEGREVFREIFGCDPDNLTF